MEIQKMNHEQVLALLPDRRIDAHKGDFGKILLLCGSRGYTGAAALAALIFGQIPSAMQLLGGALILGGLVWYSRMEGEAA